MHNHVMCNVALEGGSLTKIMEKVFLSVFILWFTIEGSVSVNVLVSMPRSMNGVLTACADQQISLTCSHDDVLLGNTRWIAGPPINCTTDVTHQNLAALPCGPFVFEEITPLVSPRPPLLNSTAIAKATVSMTGTDIECRGGNVLNSFSVGNISLCIIGQPSAPSNLTCDNITYGLNVSWEAVSDTSCAMSDVEYPVTVTRESDMMTIIELMPVTETTTEIINTLGLQPATRYIISVKARTLSGSCDGEQANITCETSASLPIVTTQPSVAPTTESTQSPTSSPGLSSAQLLSTGAIAGIAVVGIIVIVFLVLVIVFVIMIIVKKSPQGGKKGSDQGVHAPLAADTDQQQLPVYAMVDKSKNIQAEQPTYQDPAKIQHETTVSGDVYAVSDKKGKSVKDGVDAVYTEVDKSKKNQALTYAAIQVDKGKNSGQQQRTGVLYSDVQHQ